jgi:RNA polymerase sigma-70 factor, ECF subfamily
VIARIEPLAIVPGRGSATRAWRNAAHIPNVRRTRTVVKGMTALAQADELLDLLYAEHAVPLLAYVQRMLGGDRFQAEDVVQETFLRAWRNAGRLSGDARPWLFTVARRIVIDVRRQRRPAPAGAAPVSPATAAPDELEQALLSWDVTEAFRTLSADHRAVLVEVHFRDRSIAEAARVLEIPEGTVKSRTYYALHALRLALEERGVLTP